MDSTCSDYCLPPLDNEDLFDVFLNINSCEDAQNAPSPTKQAVPAFSESDLLLPSSSDDSTPTCLRSFKDADRYDMICFCTQCQDLFLAQVMDNGIDSEPRNLEASSDSQSPFGGIAVLSCTQSSTSISRGSSSCSGRKQRSTNVAGRLPAKKPWGVEPHFYLTP
ncbi:hypothetical protein BDZ45DRAFT_681113 [Acephala macrosclerotiorum]|nr:hypothetical protein BDZ45DRAFT_681113 [Acephala macrosclerotiorum]